MTRWHVSLWVPLKDTLALWLSGGPGFINAEKINIRFLVEMQNGIKEESLIIVCFIELDIQQNYTAQVSRQDLMSSRCQQRLQLTTESTCCRVEKSRSKNFASKMNVTKRRSTRLKIDYIFRAQMIKKIYTRK